MHLLKQIIAFHSVSAHLCLVTAYVKNQYDVMANICLKLSCVGECFSIQPFEALFELMKVFYL